MDYVVELSSQLGAKFNFALFGSGSLKEKVNFNSMAVFTTYEDQYEYGIVGLINNRMYHTGILSNKQMFDVLYSFVRA